ncbi:MAG: glycoside hydrolase [Lentisphaeraceae bacterium]|nr:glycoside hydrolase [Lentisphaeraceae bacterium]
MNYDNGRMRRRTFLQGLGISLTFPGLEVISADKSASSKIDVFLAAGKLGRTLMSIDDGESWIHDRSDDDNARCWCDKKDPRYVECDHDPRSFTGLDASEDGWFYAQYGWGAPGTIRRSQNFIDWEVIRTGGNGGGLAVSGNAIVSLWKGRRYRSTNQGKSWTELKDDLRMDGHPFIKSAGGKLFATARGDGQFKMSNDAGKTWKLLPDVKAGWTDSIVEGNGILVSTGTRREKDKPDMAYTARSTDGGLTWIGQELIQGKRWSANIVFNGKEFVNWADGKCYKSEDGIKWEGKKMSTGSFNSKYWGANVSVNPKTGTYVAILNVWGNHYEKQKAYRSKNGIKWLELKNDKFKGGHPIGKIILAQISRNAVKVK